MSDVLRRFISPFSPGTNPASTRGELIVVPQPPPTLQELTAKIRKAHEDAADALVTAVARAIEAGKDLIEAKEQVGHGNFEDYVVVECHFTMRTAQNYMRLAKYEPQIRQLLESKSEGRSYMTISKALKYIDILSAKKRRKARTS